MRVLLQDNNLNPYLFNAKNILFYYGACRSWGGGWQKFLGPDPGLTSSKTVAKSLGPSLHFPHLWNCIGLGSSGEKAMAPHSSALAWRIPWMEEPSGLSSMGSPGDGHDWATSLSLFTFMHWRRKWQPTPVFLPGESQGWGSLVGCRLWGHTELDTTEAT